MGKCVIISVRKAKLIGVECVAVALARCYDIVGSCWSIAVLKRFGETDDRSDEMI